MSGGFEELERQMAPVAERVDFEEARPLRNQINLVRGGASLEDAARADTSNWRCQRDCTDWR